MDQKKNETSPMNNPIVAFLAALLAAFSIIAVLCDVLNRLGIK